MNKDAKIFVAGHRGLVGSAIVRRLQKEGYSRVLTRTRQELDLLNQSAVEAFFQKEKPDFVFDAAARVGGIKANITYPSEFLYENLQIQNNIIWSAYKHNVQKFLFLGTSCIYPRDCPQPMKEEYLLTGKLEPTNEGYAIAKIAGIKLCEYIHAQHGKNFISIMPPNIYGPGDNFDVATSHVVSALLRRFYEAKENNAPEVVIWGSGVTRREFLHVDDLADAALWAMNHYNEKEFINIGAGSDISIKELAELIQKITGYQGRLVFDTTKPDGMPKKLLDNSKASALGWRPKITFEDGLRETLEWYKSTL